MDLPLKHTHTHHAVVILLFFCENLLFGSHSAVGFLCNRSGLCNIQKAITALRETKQSLFITTWKSDLRVHDVPLSALSVFCETSTNRISTVAAQLVQNFKIQFSKAFHFTELVSIMIL